MKIRYFITVPVLILCLSIIPSSAFLNSDVKKAKEFMSVDMYPEAIELLKKRINEKPTDGEAHYQLGLCYLKMNSVSAADDSFSRAAKISADYNAEIASLYQQMADANLKFYDLEKAEAYYGRMVAYNPELTNDEFQKQLGYRYLKKAADTNGSMRETYKSKAAGYVGGDLVAEVFPGAKTITVFAKTYTRKNINEKGNIPAIYWAGLSNKVQIGDYVIISCQIPGQKNYTGSEIKWSARRDWPATIDGKALWELERVPNKGTMYLYIPPEAPNSDKIEATVSIVRNVESKPNLTLLNDLIK